MAVLGTFSSIAAVVLGRTLSDAVLLSARPAINIGNFFIFSSLALMAVSLVYFQLLRVLSATKLNVFFLLFSALGVGIFQVFPLTSQNAIFAYAIFLITAPALGNIIVWNAIGDAFNARQGRRLFYLVSAASTLGGIVSGGLIPGLVKHIGMISLPIADFVSYLLMAIPVIVLRKYRRAEKTQFSVSSEGTSSSTKDFFSAVRDIVGSPLLKNLSIIFFLTAVSTNIIDFALKSYLQTFGDDEKIAIFYGYFNAVSNSFNLAVQLTLLSKFLTRFKTRTLFAVTPLVILLFSMPFVFVSNIAYLFYFIVGLRFTDVALRFVIQDSAREIAISSLPRLLRNRAKVVFKGVMNPLGGITIGLILSVFAPSLGYQYAPLLLIPVSLITLYFVRDLNRYSAYSLYKQLQSGLSSDEQRVLSASSLENVGQNAADYDPELLHDDSPHVREATLDAILLDTSLDLQKHSDVRRCAMALIARETRLAQASLVLLQACSDCSDLDETSKTLSNLTNEILITYEKAFYRLFKGMMAIYRREMIQTIFQSLSSTRASTRAQAIELLQLTLNNCPYAKRILILCDDFDNEEKVNRLQDIEHLSNEDALSLIESENDRSIAKLLTMMSDFSQTHDWVHE